MFLREYVTGSYGASAYFISKIALELPLCFLQSLLQYILVYFLCDLQGNFIFLALTAWALGSASSSVAVALGCMVSDVKQVTELAPLLYVPQLLFAGFFIKISQIPVFLRWAQYLCALKYAMNLILLTEFNPNRSSCGGDARQNCEDVLKDNDVKREDFWIYILILALLFAAFRVLGAVILVKKAKRFY